MGTFWGGMGETASLCTYLSVVMVPLDHVDVYLAMVSVPDAHFSYPPVALLCHA